MRSKKKIAVIATALCGVLAEFVGTMNRLPGEITSAGNVRVLDTVVAIRPGTGAEHTGAELSGAVDVLVRPEGLRVEAVAGGNSGSDAGGHGIVTDQSFLGSVSRIGVRLSGDVTVKVDHPSTQSGELVPGASVLVSLPGEEPVLIAERR